MKLYQFMYTKRVYGLLRAIKCFFGKHKWFTDDPPCGYGPAEIQCKYCGKEY